MLCIKCGTNYDPETKICVRCGIDLTTGRPLASDVTEEHSGPSGPQTIRDYIEMYVPGLLRPGLAAYSLILSAAGLAIVAFACGLFGYGRYMNTAMVFLLGLPGILVYAQGGAQLLAGRREWLSTILAELDAKQWILFFTYLATAATIILRLAMFRTS